MEHSIMRLCVLFSEERQIVTKLARLVGRPQIDLSSFSI
jgi:hypothetical protein